MLNWKKTLFALALASFALPAMAQDKAEATANAEQNAAAETQAREQANPAIDEAITALNETGNAIKALEDGKNDEAAAALERAIGKLEVVLTQHPELALAPVDVSSSVIDIAAGPATIKKARAEAIRLLRDDQLQLARPIISNLASEVVVRTTSIPLATYPLALKSAAALIKDDKADDAKTVLAQALNTMVIEDVVTPLPMLRAAVLIDEAKKLSEKEGRTDEENSRLADLLDAIDYQIAKGEALQYGGKDAFDPLKTEMKEIRKATGDGGFGSGIFDKLSNLFKGLGKDHAEAAAK
ncbi:MAG TPA: YfdX family protein [Rhodobacteraceae bacterium]|nr:YfdX family protein [Paracoccaceae bacterium]